ncbi:MAG: helicase-exonuclease AddAB subunit AddA [Massiliimalia sp.]|jgi:ATP-dependent helicase/nuclease subunit A
MGNVKFTPAQQNAIDVRNGNILVSAAAGSGKTAVLTQRVISLLTGETPVDADRLVIVTFTVAAAVEMKQRIEKKLAELLEQDPENALLQTQQTLLSRAHISTVHSLCSELIREHFEQLGLPSVFRVAEENELSVIKRELLDQVMEQCYEQNQPEFLHLCDRLAGKDDSRITEMVLKLYDYIRCYPEPLSLLSRFEKDYEKTAPVLETDWGKEVFSETMSYFHKAEQSLLLALEQMAGEEQVKKQYGPAFEQDLDQLRLAMQSLKEKDWDRAVSVLRHWDKKRLNAVRGYEDKAFLEVLKQHRKDADDLIGIVRGKYLVTTQAEYEEDLEEIHQVLVPLFSLVRLFYEQMEEEKAARGILDFGDLEHFAFKLLVVHKEGSYQKTSVAKELAEFYEEIMVDECQDINLIQNLIFWALSKGKDTIEDAGDAVLTSSENLFMVGDVKQSIYRFRNAVPSLFIRRSHLFPDYSGDPDQKGNCARILLQNNFRSRKEVTEAVNFFFSHAMSEGLGEMEYGPQEELVASAAFSSLTSGAKAKAELHILSLEQDEEEEKQEKIDAEASYIASLIEKMVVSGYPVQDGGQMRPCRYQDFCILLRAQKGKAQKYVEKLKEAKINCYADMSTGYFNSFEIAVMLDLLRVIDNPLLDIPLFSVLLSPMFGFTADDMAAIRLVDKKAPLYLNLQVMAQQGNMQCLEFLETLSRLRSQALILPTQRLIQKIYDETGFVFVVESMVSGEQKRANLRLLLSYAENYEAIGYRGLSGFIHFIDRAIERGEDFSCANTVSEKADVVRVMSIHGSKGLEFPICIIGDLGKQFNLQEITQSYLFHSNEGFGMNIRRPEQHKEYSNLPLEAIRLVSRREILSEEMRTLYVAMTRAKEKLILVGTCADPEKLAAKYAKSPADAFSLVRQKSYLQWMISVLGQSKQLAEAFPNLELSGKEESPYEIICGSALKGEGDQVEEIAFESVPDEAILKQLRSSIEYQYPYEELSQLPAKVTVTKLAKEKQGQETELLDDLVLEDTETFTGAQKGTILHHFMQYADFTAAKQDLEEEIQRLVEQSFLTGKEAEQLNRKKIQAFFRSSLFQRIQQAPAVYREYAFLYEITAFQVEEEISSDFAQEKILMQGIADMVIEEEDGVVIIDYKTDYLKEPEAFLERYGEQLRIYREALGAYFDLPVKECILYSLYLEREISV